MNKRARKAKYAARKDIPSPHEPQIDVVEWVKDRSKLSTRRAMSVIMSGALRHKETGKPVGYIEFGAASPGGATRKTLRRLYPAEFRTQIEVVDPA